MPKVLNFKVIIEQDEDGIFVASVPSLPGCHTQGKTYEEVLKNSKEVIELCLEEAKENPAYKAQIDLAENIQDKFLGVANIPVRFAF
ncbi:MAG: type II toxin-antitoxin system HicB family antitoxin [Candidatus Daviesbacteria bacterium]|nr:type II toxin-antitoxin system HicB family antitoxin [Candidatus Daviesbacteria bacterium]